MDVSMVEMAELLAAYAHRGQTDRAGADYILHPRAVSAAVDGPLEKVVALLHDVLEDAFIARAGPSVISSVRRSLRPFWP